MAKNSKVLLISSLALTLAFLVSYFSFSGYKPKAVKQVEEVKGLQSEPPSEIPLPDGAKKVGTNRSSDSTQITFHTEKTKAAIQEFYKNIFSTDNWVLESQSAQEEFIIAKYHNDEQDVNVTTLDTLEENDTLVSLEVSHR